MEFINGQLLVASGDGNLYLFDQKAQTGKIQVGSVIYDINFSEKGIVLSCEDGMYSVDLSREKAEKMIPLAGAVQSLYAESDLLITTYSGLYVMHNGKLYSVVPQVEFNRYALSQWQDRIFAGSIEGLFVLDRGQLLYDVIPGLTPIQVKTTSWVQYVLVLMALLVVLFAVLYFRIQRKKKGLEVEIRKKTNITPESIREAMLQNEDLISVEAIAEHFQTSTVQLNRILKRYETSGLVLVKSIKEEIFADLLQRNAEWDEISRRLGYSIAYIRRNLLKKPK
jgi:predicted transcriptional regulator